MLLIDEKPFQGNNCMSQKFGQIISFDITYNIVKESYESFDVNGAASKPKKWGLALFAGKNGNNRAVVFAVALINTEDT